MSYAVTELKTGFFKRREKKIETYDFKSFMRKDHKKQMSFPHMSLAPLALAPILSAKSAYAADMTVAAAAANTSMHAKMMTAFTPIIDLVQSLAYPVALVVVLGGGLSIMIGNSERGFSLIQRAGLGYVLVMMLPMLMDVLVEAMKSVV